MMQIMSATEEDKDELLALYHAMIGDHVNGVRPIRMRTRSHLILRMKIYL